MTFEDLIKDEKLTFLVGAGCSIDSPSCIPAGKEMMREIISYTCVDSEIEKIINIEGLRFEQLVEIVRDLLDKDLKIIDYYGECDKPNIQHFFLAEMIKKGHYVVTTNFDFLIEYALLQSGVPKEEILPVITKSDYEKYNNPDELFKDKKKTVYKIHGSTKNIIKDELTKDTLIATIQAFGSNKRGLSVFQLEPFKSQLFDNISHGRTLVVMGYSGSDDFDIVPTLKVLNNLKQIIWIDFIYNDNGSAEIVEIDVKDDSQKKDKVHNILKEIKKINDNTKVYHVVTNTKRLISDLFETQFAISQEKFSLKVNDWLTNNLNIPSNIIKNVIPYKIYFTLNMFDDAMSCTEQILKIVSTEESNIWKATALNNIGNIYTIKNDYTQALSLLNNALEIYENLGALQGKTTSLTNISVILAAMGDYEGALIRSREALEIDEQLENLQGKAIHLVNIGNIYQSHANYKEAIDQYKKALKINQQLGNLLGRANCLNNIATIHFTQGNYFDSLREFQVALDIYDQLRDYANKSVSLSNIANIYHNLGVLPEALKQYQESLEIGKKLGLLSLTATILNNMGRIHKAQGNNSEALKYFENSLDHFTQIGELPHQAVLLNNIGSIFEERGEYDKALELYYKGLQLYEHLEDLANKSNALNNIASVYNLQGKFKEAYNLLEEALQILIQIGLGESYTAQNIKTGIEHLKTKL